MTPLRISSSCSELEEVFGTCGAVEELAKIGFDGIDFPFFTVPVSPFPYEDEGYVREIRQTADRAGIAIAQTHTPFPTFVADPERDETIFQATVASLKATALLGCRYAVVHPQIPAGRLYRKGVEATRAQNLAFFRKLLPYAREYGVRLAIENMWGFDPVKRCIAPTVCSTPEEHCQFVDMLEDDHVVACLDTGHSVLTNVDVAEWIGALGARLQVLHVHDVDGAQDNHFCPFLGVTDWPSVMRALRKAGYGGYFNLEAGGTGLRFPKALRPDAQKLILKTARYLLSLT